MSALIARISRWAWVTSYDLEQRRERHAVNGRYFRSAACCVSLAALRFFGGHA